MVCTPTSALSVSSFMSEGKLTAMNKPTLNQSLICPITDIKPYCDRQSEWAIKKMKQVLNKQGQIEPLQVNIKTNSVFAEDPHGDDILYAAEDLKWPTILVVFLNRYIP